MHYRAYITIGDLESDPDNTRKKKLNFRKGRSITKWYRAPNMLEAMSLANKTKHAKINRIDLISYEEYVKGVEKHHEY